MNSDFVDLHNNFKAMPEFSYTLVNGNIDRCDERFQTKTYSSVK